MDNAGHVLQFLQEIVDPALTDVLEHNDSNNDNELTFPQDEAHLLITLVVRECLN